MNYVEFFDLLGEEAKQIPSITGAGAPTTLTEGAVGCLYMDTTTGEIYKCTAAEEGVYTWLLITALVQTLEGNEENVAPSVQAVNESLEGKLDKQYKSNGIWAYTINQGVQELMQLNTTPTGWSIPLYGTNGVMYTNDPTLSVSGNADLACTNKKYVDDLAATKVDKWTGQGGNYRLYGVESDGKTQTMYNTNSGNYPAFITRWGTSTSGTTDNGGYLTTSDPVNPYHAATKNYVDTVADTKLNIFTVQGNAGDKVYVARADGEQDTVFIGDSPDYIAPYLSSSSTRGDNQPTGYLVSHNPSKPYHVAVKKYVDDVAATKLDLPQDTTLNVQYMPTWVRRKNEETGEYYIQQVSKRVVDGLSSVTAFNAVSYLPNTASYGSTFKDGGAVLLTGEPKQPCHAATKNYVDNAIGDVKSKLDAFGIFYDFVKECSGTPHFEIPAGVMPTAYIASASFAAYSTDDTLAYSGEATSITFMDENWAYISSVSFTAPAFIEVPENARHAELNCMELIPDDVGWDAGPLISAHEIYFQVKRGG